MTEFETTFEVAATPEEAWEALEHLQDGQVGEPGPRRWWLPGFESTGSEVEVTPARALSVRKDDWPCAGTLIAITFDHLATGARITVVQSGFDEAFVAGSGEGFWIVCEQIAADLRLFFATGVLGGRHNRPWSLVGCDVVVAPTGLEVTRVYDGTWAERVGVRAGDVLLTLAGAPLTATRDFVTVQRIVRPGDEVAAVWARGSERMEASLPL